jgi:ribosomal protein S18 acetylase RimI-like enzyme
MNRADRKTPQIAPAEENAWPDALAIAFGHLPREQCEARVAEAVRRHRTGDGGDVLLTGRRDGRLVGAVYATIQPGRTAIVVPPQLVAGESPQTACELVAAAVEELQRRGVRLAQALETTNHGTSIDAFEANGFRHVSDLMYLVWLSDSFGDVPFDSELEFVSDLSPNHERLADIVERTYEGSLDCPAIDKVRSIEDVLEGYRAVGAFDPDRWLIARQRDRDIGCLLLAAYPKNQHWELVYMGVVPEARGRGLGLALVRHAQRLAREGRATRLALAVDAANEPAMDAYETAGFTTWDRRTVYVRAF